MPVFSVFVDQTNLKTNWKFSLSQYRFYGNYKLRWRLPIKEHACRKTRLCGGDYKLRTSAFPPPSNQFITWPTNLQKIILYYFRVRLGLDIIWVKRCGYDRRKGRELLCYIWDACTKLMGGAGGSIYRTVGNYLRKIHTFNCTIVHI